MSFAIETERLILRDIEEADFPYLLDHFTNPSGLDNVLSHQSNEAFVRWLIMAAIATAKQQPRQHYILAVTLKPEQTVIGNCMLIDAEPESIKANIGWNIINAYEGQGYATETAHRLLALGFETNEVTRIYADCFAYNRASIRVMEKIGMTPNRNGLLRRWWRSLRYSERRPIVRHQLWREQWLSLNSRTDSSRASGSEG